MSDKFPYSEGDQFHVPDGYGLGMYTIQSVNEENETVTHNADGTWETESWESFMARGPSDSDTRRRVKRPEIGER